MADNLKPTPALYTFVRGDVAETNGAPSDAGAVDTASLLADVHQTPVTVALQSGHVVVAHPRSSNPEPLARSPRPS